MNFISKQSRRDRLLLDDGCSDASGLLAAAREVAPLPLQNRIDHLQRHINRLEIPNIKHGKIIELSRSQRSRQVLPIVFQRDAGLMMVGDSAVYIGDEQQRNHADWLKWQGVEISPTLLAEEAIANIRQRTLSTGRIFFDPSRKEADKGVFDAMTVQPGAQLETAIDGWGRLIYHLGTNPIVAVFNNALTKGRDPLGLTILHEVVHVQQTIDQPAVTQFDLDNSSIDHKHAILEIDAYRLVYDAICQAYKSSSPYWGGNDDAKQLPAARDGLYIENITKGLPVTRIPGEVLDEIAKKF